MAGPERRVIHIVIHGRVQGVGYRAWAADEASERGLEGFVRNRRNGTVEALFAGPADVVADMVAACRQGPLGAAVLQIDQSEGADDLLSQRRSGERFSLLPTV